MFTASSVVSVREADAQESAAPVVIRRQAAKADLHDGRTLSQKCEDPGHARTSKWISAFGGLFRSLESGLCNEEIHTAKAIRHYFHDLEGEHRGFLNKK
jgi:hypothetical protein